MKDNGSKECKMDMVSSILLMGMFILGIGKMMKQLVMESINMLRGHFIGDIG